MLKKIKLKGEQKKVLFLPPKNPILIKGVAGSGKTTVALYRAKHLLDTQSNLFNEAKVAIFTYNKTLTAYISQISHEIEVGYQPDSNELKQNTKPGINVTIINFHKWAHRYLDLNSNKTIDGYEAKKIIKSIIYGIKEAVNNKLDEQSNSTDLEKKNSKDKAARILDKSVTFFADEISWIKGKLFKDKSEYLETARTGRGVIDRVTKTDKQGIWLVYERYKKVLQEREQVDFDDFAILALIKIQNDPNFIPPFTHIVIDEAQDLNKAQILVLSRLVSPETNSISIIADRAQRIVKSGFSWKEVGLNVLGGRTIELKKNYRNSIYIARAAWSLLDKETDKSEFTDIETALKGGEKPKIAYYSNHDEQLINLDDQLTILKNSSNLKGTVILHRFRSELKQIIGFLDVKGFSTELVNSNKAVNYYSDSIKICTMSSIKGLEFNNVILLDLNDDIIPFPSGFMYPDDQDHISTERRLLYTCMTRARINLFLFCSDKENPSRYLKEIDVNLLDDISPKYSSDDEVPF